MKANGYENNRGEDQHREAPKPLVAAEKLSWSNQSSAVRATEGTIYRYCLGRKRRVAEAQLRSVWHMGVIGQQADGI